MWIFLNIFNWIIVLQSCVSFCHTPTWISHKYTYVPSSWIFLPLPHLSPLGCHRATGWTPCITQQSPLAIYFPYSDVYGHATLSVCSTLSFPDYVHKSVLHVCTSTAAPQTVHQYHSSRFQTYVLIHDYHFSLTYFTLYNSSRLTGLTRSNWNSYLFMANSPYVPQLLYPFICQWTSRLLPRSGYCK